MKAGPIIGSIREAHALGEQKELKDGLVEVLILRLTTSHSKKQSLDATTSGLP